MGLSRTIYCGAFVFCKSLQELDICRTGAIGVNELGRIAFIERSTDDLSGTLDERGWGDAKLVQQREHGFFFPGFVGMLVLKLSHL